MSEEKNRTQQEIYEKIDTLSGNRVGAIPVGMMLEISGDKIRKAIEKFLESRGVNLDQNEVAVECYWDRNYDSVMRTGHDNGSVPFRTEVLTRVSEKGGKRFNGNAPIDVLHRMMAKNASTEKNNGVVLESRKDLAAAIAEFNDPDSQNMSKEEKAYMVKWKPWKNGKKKKKTNIFVTYLDFDQVFRYIMKDNGEDMGKNKVSYDIVDKRYIKNQYGENIFSIRVQKQFVSKEYRRFKPDHFHGVRR